MTTAEEQAHRELAEARNKALENLAEERLAKIFELKAEHQRITRDLYTYCDATESHDDLITLGKVLDAAVAVNSAAQASYRKRKAKPLVEELLRLKYCLADHYRPR